jgi:sortase A
MRPKIDINLLSTKPSLKQEHKFKKIILGFLKFFSLAVIIFMLTIVILHWPWINAKLRYWWKQSRNINNNILENKSEILDTQEIIPADDRLIIPKIGVNSPIVWMESDQEEDIQKYLQNGVGHYPNTAFPGEVGNCFITGHSSNYWWKSGGYNYVFALLDELLVGDQTIIYYKQKKYVYEVYEVKIVSPENTEVLQPTSEPTITLMTCTPPGTDWRRLIVRAKQIEPDPRQNITPSHPHLLPLE